MLFGGYTQGLIQWHIVLDGGSWLAQRKGRFGIEHPTKAHAVAYTYDLLGGRTRSAILRCTELLRSRVLVYPSLKMCPKRQNNWTKMKWNPLRCGFHFILVYFISFLLISFRFIAVQFRSVALYCAPKSCMLVCSVGAYHDGQNNECSSDRQFVMATAPQTLTDSNFNNPFRFSRCSARAFRRYINRLNS